MIRTNTEKGSRQATLVQIRDAADSQSPHVPNPTGAAAAAPIASSTRRRDLPGGSPCEAFLARASGKHVPDTGAQRLLTGSYQRSARAYVLSYCLEDMLVRDIFLIANSAPPGTDTGLKPSVQGASPPSRSLSH